MSTTALPGVEMLDLTDEQRLMLDSVLKLQFERLGQAWSLHRPQRSMAQAGVEAGAAGRLHGLVSGKPVGIKRADVALLVKWVERERDEARQDAEPDSVAIERVLGEIYELLVSIDDEHWEREERRNAGLWAYLMNPDGFEIEDAPGELPRRVARAAVEAWLDVCE